MLRPWTFIVLCLVAGGVGIARIPRLLASDARSSRESRDAEGLGDSIVEFLRWTEQFPDGISGSVLVAQDGEILVHEAFGLADADDESVVERDSLWDIASATKQFTAAGVLRLQQQGKLHLDDPLTKFFPMAPENKSSVTIRQLLNHTSGIANSYDHAEAVKTVDFNDRDQAIAFYLQLPMDSQPGEKWAYSNLGYNLVAAVIEMVTSKPWEDFIRDDVLRAAGLTDSWALGDPGLPKARVPRGSRGTGPSFPYGEVSHWAGYVGAGGVHTSVSDLYLWDRVLRSERLLTEESLKELFTPGLEDYALGWRIDSTDSDRRRAFHGGMVGGFVCHIVRGLDEDIFVAVLTNDSWPGAGRTFADRLYQIVLNNEDVIVPGSSADVAANIEGRYETDDGDSIVVAADDDIVTLTTRDWDIARQALRAQGKFVDAGSTVNDLLPETIASLRAGKPSNLAQDVSDVSRSDWKKLFSGDSDRGEFRGYKILGYIMRQPGIIDQFVQLEFANRKQVTVRFRWEAGEIENVDGLPVAKIAIHDIELEPPSYATVEFNATGGGVFRAGKEDSWQGIFIKIEGKELRLSGFQRCFVWKETL